MVRRKARFDWNNEYGYVVKVFFWLNHSLPNVDIYIRQLYKKIKKMPSIHLTYSLYTTSLPKHTDYQRALYGISLGSYAMYVKTNNSENSIFFKIIFRHLLLNRQSVIFSYNIFILIFQC